MMPPHPDPEVNAAITRLNDALCHYERIVLVDNVLILREAGGWCHRSMNGKPVPEDVSDEDLLGMVP